MLGPFYSRDLVAISGSELETLYKTENYSDVRKDSFPKLHIIIRTRWMGYDRDKSFDPPRIFTVQVFSGTLDYDEQHFATEPGALEAHQKLVDRFEMMMKALEDGTPFLLTDGVL